MQTLEGERDEGPGTEKKVKVDLRALTSAAPNVHTTKSINQSQAEDKEGSAVALSLLQPEELSPSHLPKDDSLQ